MSDKLKNHEPLPQEDLEQVAGGNKAQFNEICKTLHMEGSSPEQVKKFLSNRAGIEVKHFNMGHLGGIVGQKNAEYYLRPKDVAPGENPETWTKLTHEQVLGLCQGYMAGIEMEMDQ